MAVLTDSLADSPAFFLGLAGAEERRDVVVGQTQINEILIPGGGGPGASHHLSPSFR